MRYYSKKTHEIHLPVMLQGFLPGNFSHQVTPHKEELRFRIPIF